MGAGPALLRLLWGRERGEGGLPQGAAAESHSLVLLATRPFLPLGTPPSKPPWLLPPKGVHSALGCS